MMKNKLFLGVLMICMCGGSPMYGAASSGPGPEALFREALSSNRVSIVMPAFFALPSNVDRVAYSRSLARFLIGAYYSEGKKLVPSTIDHLAAILTNEDPLIVWLRDLTNHAKLNALEAHIGDGISVSSPAQLATPLVTKSNEGVLRDPIARQSWGTIEMPHRLPERPVALAEPMQFTGAESKEPAEARLPHIINVGGPIYFRVKDRTEKIMQLRKGSLEALPGFEGVYKLESGKSLTLPYVDERDWLRFRIWPGFIEDFSAEYLNEHNRKGVSHMDALSYQGLTIKEPITTIVDDASGALNVKFVAERLPSLYPVAKEAIPVNLLHDQQRVDNELSGETFEKNMFTISIPQDASFRIKYLKQAVAKAYRARVHYRADPEYRFNSGIDYYPTVGNFGVAP